MSQAIQEGIYQQVRIRFTLVDKYEKKVRSVIRDHCNKDGDQLNRLTMPTILQHIQKDLSDIEWSVTEGMFKSIFLFIVGFHLHQMHRLSTIKDLLTTYPEFSTLLAKEQTLVLDFLNVLNIALLIFRPQEVSGMLFLMSKISGLAHSPLHDKAVQLHDMFTKPHHTTSAPQIPSSSSSNQPVRPTSAELMSSIQDEWDSADRAEREVLHTAHAFWHHHCVKLLTGHDIPSVSVSTNKARWSHLYPTHDLDWSAPTLAPYPTSSIQLPYKSAIPPPLPLSDDFHTNYAGQLRQHTLHLMDIYMSGGTPIIDFAEVTHPPVKAIDVDTTSPSWGYYPSPLCF